MHLGTLRQRLDIQVKTIVGSKSPAGYEPNEVWVDWKKSVPCSVSVRRGQEHFLVSSDAGAGQRYSREIYFFTVRYGSVNGLNTAMRIRHDGLFFDIRTIRPDNQYRRNVVIEAEVIDSVIGKSPLIPSIKEVIPQGWVGEAYDGFVVTAKGGSSPYIFAADSGGLPPGLDIDPTTGAVSGVPSEDGTWPVSLSVIDADGSVATVPDFSIKINPGV